MANANANPKIVDWAIRESGFTHSEIADHLKIELSALQAIVTGEVDITVGQLEKLRKKLRRPSSTFYLPNAPQDIEDVARRLAPGDKQSTRPPEERFAIRKSKRIQDELRGVLLDARINLEPIPKYSLTDKAAEVAEEMRDWLALPSEVEPSPTKTFRRLRSILGDHRIFVLLHPFGTKGARGFSLQDEVAPVVGINTSTWSPGVRSYTMMHELGHILTRTSSSCGSIWAHTHKPNDSVERWCETFAANVLMPTKLMDTARKGLGNLTPERAAVRIANTFHVSRQAAFIRLIEVGHVTWQDYNDSYQPKGDQKGGGRASPDDERRTREVVCRDMLGEAAVRVLKMGVETDYTSPIQTIRLLGIDTSELNTLVSDAPRDEVQA